MELFLFTPRKNLEKDILPNIASNIGATVKGKNLLLKEYFILGDLCLLQIIFLMHMSDVHNGCYAYAYFYTYYKLCLEILELICMKQRPRSACIFVQSDQRLCYLLTNPQNL